MCEGSRYSRGLGAWLGSLPTGTARSAGICGFDPLHGSIPTVGDSAVCVECSMQGIPFSVTPVITQNPAAPCLQLLTCNLFPRTCSQVATPYNKRCSFIWQALLNCQCCHKQKMQTLLLNSGMTKNDNCVDVKFFFTTFFFAHKYMCNTAEVQIALRNKLTLMVRNHRG